MKKALIFSFVLGIFFCVSAICVSAQGTYSVICSSCSGSGLITTSEQVYGRCSDCYGQRFVFNDNSAKICFTCGSRSCKYVPGYNYGNIVGNAHYECNNCGSGEVYNGYKCTTCNGAGSCYNTVVTQKNCTRCNGCGSITVTCVNHNYGFWKNIDSAKHSRTCYLCKNVETTNHTWDSGVVTKTATCKQFGTKTYTCTGCNATKTEDIAKTTDHKYGGWTKMNDATHKHTCSVCAKEETANHSWNSGTVTKKATCKEAGVKTLTCIDCNTTKTESIAKLTIHTYDHACDSNCNICGQTRSVTHRYESLWSKDETSHWHACSGCEEKYGYAAHDFENACDPDCSICGYTRETEHDFEEKWTTDEAKHYHVCIACGQKDSEAVHEPGAAATETTAQTCTICGYEIAPALGGGDTTEPSVEPTQPTTTAPAADNAFPWWTVIVAVVVIGGGAAIVIVKKKKA